MMRKMSTLTNCCLTPLAFAAILLLSSVAAAHHNWQDGVEVPAGGSAAAPVRETPLKYNEICVENGGSVSGVIRFFSGKAVIDVKDAVVYIKGIRRGKPFTGLFGNGTPFIDQKDFVFVPHVTVIPVGGTVELRNADPEMHNVHSYSGKNASFNEAIPSAGRPVLKKFDFVEAVRIGCNLHQEMSAWIVTRDNPYYCLTGDDGSFRIEGVPPGTYKLAVWHEDFDRKELTAVYTDIDVEPGSEFEVDFYLSRIHSE
ncbi:MAG: hypothetical protein J3T61_02480 [Candidatus Brocadiales bacterium]|nr:hypothetical protein [Candidatus Bathyanammoxibius sp.]